MVEIACEYVIAPRKTIRLELLFSNDPISFFGGVNAADGKVSDYRHGSYQQSMSNKAFAVPFGKGSSGAGLVLMEMMRLKTAPAAIINIRTDPVILTGPLISRHYYEQILPVINMNEQNYARLANMKEIELFATGAVLNAFPESGTTASSAVARSPAE
jgi:predicted aconitase with swiveling domain